MYDRVLERHIHHGNLRLHLPDGRVRRYGSSRAPTVDWVIHRPGTLERILRDPEFELGHTYLDGDWDAGAGQLRLLLDLLLRDFPIAAPVGARSWLSRIAELFRQWNRLARSYRNVAHHYDLDEWLFRLFLDQDMHYSCGYYYAPDIGLEEAQRAKVRHIVAKLRLTPGQRVLDIGCGWGALAVDMAMQCGVEVVGLTLSREQLRVARERAAAHGLAHAVRFELQDYREHHGHYDRIVSVGMFEHVGRPYYRRFFIKVRELLAEDGMALLHSIGRLGASGPTNAWMRRYIFPGAYIPALSEISRPLEDLALYVSDIEVLRLHYALTLAAWQQRFQRQRVAVAARMSERFCRMWEFYLAVCEAAFRRHDMAVFQIQFTKQLDSAPLTRDYLYGASATARRNDTGAAA